MEPFQLEQNGLENRNAEPEAEDEKPGSQDLMVLILQRKWTTVRSRRSASPCRSPTTRRCHPHVQDMVPWVHLCATLAFSNQFFGYRQNPLYILSLSVQISRPAHRPADGGLPPADGRRHQGDAVVLLTEPRAVQPQEARPHHHLCKLRLHLGPRRGHNHHREGLLLRGIHPVAAMMLTQTTQLMGYGRTVGLASSESSLWTPPTCGGLQT